MIQNTGSNLMPKIQADKVVFNDAFKKLEGIKKRLKKVPGFDELQSIITEYDKIDCHADAIMSYRAIKSSAGKKLDHRIARIDELLFKALCKQYEGMLHRLESDIDSNTLKQLSQQFEALKIDDGAVFRYIQRHKSSQIRIAHLGNAVLNALKKIEKTMQDQVKEIPLGTLEDLISETSQISLSFPISSETDMKEVLQPIAAREKQLATFQLVLTQLQNKRDELHKRYPKDAKDDMTTAYGSAYQLTRQLNDFTTQYKYGELELNEFKNKGMKLIREHRNGVLGIHRGCKEIVANLFLAIGTLGIGYALAALFTQRMTPIKLKTESVEKMDQVLQSMQALA